VPASGNGPAIVLPAYMSSTQHRRRLPGQRLHQASHDLPLGRSSRGLSPRGSWGVELKQISVRIANELGALTSRKVPKTFASYVYVTRRSEAKRAYGDGLQHLYFLFHPGNNSHPGFQGLVTRNPLPDNLVAMSESLDCLAVWRKFVRGYLDRAQPQISKDCTMFHITIPAYETTVIKDPLGFPDVGLLMIHGETYRQQPLMWFNLPTVENYHRGRLTSKHVGNMARQESDPAYGQPFRRLCEYGNVNK